MLPRFTLGSLIILFEAQQKACPSAQVERVLQSYSGHRILLPAILRMFSWFYSHVESYTESQHTLL